MARREKIYQKVYAEWVGKDNLIRCPDCNTIRVAHIVVSNEGELFECTSCGKTDKIGEDFQKKRQGGLRINVG